MCNRLKRWKCFQEKNLAVFVSILLIVFVGVSFYHYSGDNYQSNVVADSEPTEYTLTVSVVGSGTTSATTGTYTEGTVVQASASPNANWTFGYWLLDELNKTANPISVTMNSNHVLTAIFNENPVTFTSTFGVCLQYFSEEETAAYFPDMWTLVKSIGASHISGAPRRWVADEAAEHGIKCMFIYTEQPHNPETLPEYFTSKEAMISYLSKYNISQYQNHEGVYGHILTHEPWNDYIFDPRYPDQATLDLIEVLRAGVEYIKSQDPTHPVWVALDPAGSYVEDSDKVYLEKRRAWISLFIDFCDVLDYHYYGAGNSGMEWWRNEDGFRQKLVDMLDTVLIPGSKGKPIIFGEMGCPSSPFLDWQGKLAQFNETLQAEYFRIFGEETRARGIFVFVWKLIDAGAWSYSDYGLFNTENNGTINIPKLSANLVRGYLSIEENPPESP